MERFSTVILSEYQTNIWGRQAMVSHAQLMYLNWPRPAQSAWYGLWKAQAVTFYQNKHHYSGSNTYIFLRWGAHPEKKRCYRSKCPAKHLQIEVYDCRRVPGTTSRLRRSQRMVIHPFTLKQILLRWCGKRSSAGLGQWDSGKKAQTGCRSEGKRFAKDIAREIIDMLHPQTSLCCQACNYVFLTLTSALSLQSVTEKSMPWIWIIDFVLEI